MSAPRRVRGFTLLEMFVVIFVIAVLLVLIMSRLQKGQIGNRRATCANNMRNIAIALVNFESRNGGFPGYANVINNKRASWVIPILPNLERMDLYQAWTDTPPVNLPLRAGSTETTLASGTPNPWARSTLSILVCPSARVISSPSNPLSYVVNTGSARTANDFLPPLTSDVRWVEDRNSGVFFNRAGADFHLAEPTPNPPPDAFTPSAGPVTNIDFIFQHDGTAYTLLLSENLQATTWASDPTDTVNKPPNPFQSEFQIRQNTGFVWFVTGNKDNAGPAPRSAQYNPQGIGINALGNVVTRPVPMQAYPVPGSDPPTGGLAYARPSSMHPGGVNVIFCDIHYRFIGEDIDYKVYTALMTPNGRDAIIELPDVTATNAGWNYGLDEADY